MSSREVHRRHVDEERARAAGNPGRRVQRGRDEVGRDRGVRGARERELGLEGGEGLGGAVGHRGEVERAEDGALAVGELDEHRMSIFGERGGGDLG